MKRLQTIVFLLFIFISAGFAADEVTFKANAPRTVVANKPFQLSYTLNTRAGKDLRVPELNGFEVLAGPFTSTSSSTQWINGKRSSSTTCTYTYTLLASEPGEYTIPSGTISIKHDKYTSNGLKIKVLPSDQVEEQNAQGNATGRQQSQSSSPSLSDKNLFVRTIVSKTNVHEQECVLLTYKLYTLVDVSRFTNNTKFPDFNGFLKQEIEADEQQQLSTEHYKGRNYGTVVLHQVLLYPQRSGEIIIEPARFEAEVRMQNQAQVKSIFDDFFDSYSNVTKMLIAPGVKINVKALPQNPPKSFSSAVGKFSVSSDISTTALKAHEAVTLKLKIVGKGNMKLIKTPEIKFPEGIEAYNPKVSNDFKNTTSGVSGTKTIEYMFIPRIGGNYTIPPIEFSYFDVDENRYKTLNTLSYDIVVEKSKDENANVVTGGNYTSKEDLKMLGKDIRYIYNGEIKLAVEKKTLIGTWIFWLLFLVPTLISAGIFILYRKRIRANADTVKLKNRKANQVAQRRLKIAQKHWKNNEKELFYNEILKVLWTYMSDKLSIPVAALNKENVRTELQRNAISDQLIDTFVEVLNTCEFARYAPATTEDPMGELYKKTIDVISEMENAIKGISKRTRK